MHNYHRLSERVYYTTDAVTTRSFTLPPDLPVVVFDCNPGYGLLNVNRRIPIVSGAARELGAKLIHDRIAVPVFMESAFIEEGVLPYEEEIRDRSLIFFITLLDVQYQATRDEVKRIRERYPHAKICIGGPSVIAENNLQKTAAFFPEVDVIVLGDGDLVQKDLINLFSGRITPDKAKDTLKGVYLRLADGEIFCDATINKLTADQYAERPSITSYPELVEQIIRDKTLKLNTSRGCLYHCVFCQNHRDELLAWTPERIIHELRCIKTLIEAGYLPEEAKVIAFQDDDFLLNKERAKAFFSLLIDDSILADYFSISIQTGISSFYDYYPHYVLLGEIEKAGDIEGCCEELSRRLTNGDKVIGIGIKKELFANDNEGRDRLLAKIDARFPNDKTCFVPVQADLQFANTLVALDQALVDLLAKAKLSQIYIGTDGFSDRMIRLLGKHRYNQRMIGWVADALSRHRIYQQHYAIFTHPRLTRSELIEHLNEVFYFLSDFERATFSISSVYPRVLENTPLSRLKQLHHPLEAQYQMKAGSHTKHLPFPGILYDWDLFDEFQELLGRPLSVDLIPSVISNTGAETQILLNTIYSDFRGRHRPVTIADALTSPIQILQVIALIYLIEEFGKTRP